MNRTNRKAYMRTLEGALGTIIILMFIFYIMPQIPMETKIEEPTKTFVIDTLSTLDQSGLLESSLIRPDPNTTRVENALMEIMPTSLNFSLKYTTLNSSSGTITTPGSHTTAYLNFTSNSTTLDKSTLTIYFHNSTNPKITLNTNEVYTSTGTINTPKRLDLTPFTIDGNNTLNITTENPSTINYILNIHQKTATPSIPQDRATAAVTYLLQGNRTEFIPGIITVYIWEK